MKTISEQTIYDVIEDQAAGFFAIWDGLHTVAVKNDEGNIDDFRIRGLLELLLNASERLERTVRDYREISEMRKAEQKTSCHGNCHN